MLHDNGYDHSGAETHEHREKTHTPRSFIETIVTLKSRVASGGHIPISYNDKLFFAVPLSETSNLKDPKKSEIIKDVAIDSDKGRRGSGTMKVIKFKQVDLEKMLDKLTDITCQSICFTGEDPISFITQEAHNRLMVRRERERFRKIAADEGADLSIGFKTEPVQEASEAPVAAAIAPAAPTSAAPAPAPRKPADPAAPFGDIRSVALPLFVEEILYHKSQAVNGRPVRIVYDSKNFYGVSVHQAKGLKTHSTSAERGDRLTIKISALHDILKSLRDNMSATLMFNKGQICLVNQAAFDKIEAKAMEAAGVAPATPEETEVPARKEPSARQLRLMEQAGQYKYPDAISGSGKKPELAEPAVSPEEIIIQTEPTITETPDEPGIPDESPAEESSVTPTRRRARSVKPDARMAANKDFGRIKLDGGTAVLTYQEKPYGILVPAENLDKMGILKEDLPILTSLGREYTGAAALSPVSGLIERHGKPMIFASLGYMHETPDMFSRFLNVELHQQIQDVWKADVRQLLNDFWLKANPYGIKDFRTKPGSFINAVNGVSDSYHASDFQAGSVVALTGNNKVTGFVLAGEGFKGDPVVYMRSAREINEGIKGYKEAESDTAVLVIKIADNTASVIKPDFNDSFLNEMLKHSPSVEDMVAAMTGAKTPKAVLKAYIESHAKSDVSEPEAPVVQASEPPASPTIVPLPEDGASILQRVAKIANTLKDLKVDGSKLVEVMIDDNHIVGFGADRSALFSDDTAISNLAEIYNGLKGNSDPTLEYKLVAYDDSVSVKDKIGILKQAFDETAGNQKLIILRAGQQTIIVGNNTAFTEIVRDYV